jgi:hypothetical protein
VRVAVWIAFAIIADGFYQFFFLKRDFHLEHFFFHALVFYLNTAKVLLFWIVTKEKTIFFDSFFKKKPLMHCKDASGDHSSKPTAYFLRKNA